MRFATPHLRYVNIIFFMLLVYVCSRSVGQIDTETYTEGKMFNFALGLLNGDKSWAAYDTNPFGAAFIMTPFITLGLNTIDYLRWVPLITACLAATFFLSRLMIDVRSNVSRPYLTLLFCLVIFQPDFYQWAASLHNQSYQLTLSMLSAIACLRVKRVWGVLFILSFIEMFISYHFVPAFVFMSLSFRVIYYFPKENNIDAKFITNILIDFFFIVAGIALAWFVNITFGAILLGGYANAIQDWIGRLLVRADLGGQGIASYYYDYVESHLTKTYIPTRFEIFSKYITHLIFGVQGLINFVILVTLVLALRRIKTLRCYNFKKLIALVIMSLSLSLLGGVCWGVALPKHFVIHEWFLLRDMIVVQLALVTLCVQLVIMGETRSNLVS